MMFQTNSRSMVGYAIIVVLASLPARGDDYLVYSRFTPPGVTAEAVGVTAVGAYVEDYGVPGTWGDEIQYIYFLVGTVGYKYRVWATNDGGPDDPTANQIIEIKQHPKHPDPRFVGAIEPRHFEFVSKADLKGYTLGSFLRPSGVCHADEFHVDSSGVYLGAHPYGIHMWDHNWKYVGQVAKAPPEKTESLAYNPAEKTWYAGARSRTIYQLRDTDEDGTLMDESWRAIFTYPNYAGDHHDGMEYAGGFLWISDMTSDVLGKWKYDAGTHLWSEAKRFYYSEPADVEGMGFGPFNHFWVGSGSHAPICIYELGDYCLQPCVVAEAGEGEDSWPPTVELEFNGSGSHTTHPDTKIVLYEWDFDGDGVCDYGGTDPVARHAYPAYFDPNDPNRIDWRATAACFTAVLRVTVSDPNGVCKVCDSLDSRTTDVDTRTVCITPPPWGPVADPNGPYNAWVNELVRLNGSKSFHPAALNYKPGHPWYDDIVRWEWDLDNDADFDDATGKVVSMSWDARGTYPVALRVTDGGGRFDEKRTTVIVDYSKHDLAVTLLQPSKTSRICIGEVIPILVTVSNLGDYPENFGVTLSCDDKTIDTKPVALALGEDKTVPFSWNTAGIAPQFHTIKACADIVPGEFNRADNYREIPVEVNDTYTLILSSGAGGSITVPGQGEFTYDCGTTVPIKVKPDPNFGFSHWTGTAAEAGKVDPNDPDPNLTMDSDYALDAHFIRLQYKLKIDSTEGGSVVVPGEGEFPYDCGTAVSIKVKSDACFTFSHWTGTPEGIDPADPNLTIVMDRDYTLKAYFTKLQYKLRIDSAEGDPIVVPGQGEFTYDCGTAVPIKPPIPSPCFVFSHWGGIPPGIDPRDPNLIIVIDRDYTLIAHFTKLQYRLKIDSTEGGSVAVPGQGEFTYDCGTPVSIKAKSDACFTFSRWTGTPEGIDPADPNLTIVMDRDYTLKARFIKLQYKLRIDSTEGGSVPVPGQGEFTYDCGTTVPIKAKTDPNCVFSHWTGTPSRIDPREPNLAIVMDRDYTLMANFTIRHRLTVSATPGGSIYVGTRTGNVYAAWYDKPMPPLDHGTEVTVIATPYDGWKFTGWSGTMGSSESPFTFGLTEDCRLEALFTPE